MKVSEKIQRPFIVLAFSTTFPSLFVNKSFIPGVSAHCTNQYALRWDVHFFLWPGNFHLLVWLLTSSLFPLFHILGCKLYYMSITAPQECHKRLVLQVCVGLNTLEFSAIQLVAEVECLKAELAVKKELLAKGRQPCDNYPAVTSSDSEGEQQQECSHLLEGNSNRWSAVVKRKTKSTTAPKSGGNCTSERASVSPDNRKFNVFIHGIEECKKGTPRHVRMSNDRSLPMRPFMRFTLILPAKQFATV